MPEIRLSDEEKAAVAGLRMKYEHPSLPNPYQDIELNTLQWGIPALGLYVYGKHVFSMTVLAIQVISLAFIVYNWGLVYNGLYSLGLAVSLAVLSWDNLSDIFTTEILEFWIAPLYLVMLLLATDWVSRRRLKKLHAIGDEKRDRLSLGKMAWREFTRRTVAVVALYIVGVLYSFALLAPLIAPYDPNDQQDFVVTAFQPPLATLSAFRLGERETQTIPLRDDQDLASQLANRLIEVNFILKQRGETEKKLFVNDWRRENEEVVYRQGIREKRVPFASLKGGTIESSLIQKRFFLGTDQYGRDIFSRVIYGSRISLSIGFLVILIAITIGTLLGVTAGYLGGIVDAIIMRIVDILNAFPKIFLILIIIALFGNSIFLIVLTISLTGWMNVSRLVRSQVLSLKEQDFITAAIALGYGTPRIIFNHLIPNSLTPVIIAATLSIGGIILTEAALSFLGLGVQPPTASWGNIISEGRDNLLNHWWISTFPGLAIVLTVVCFNLVGDGVRDALDPRQRSLT